MQVFTMGINEDDKIKTIIEERKRKDSELFFVDASVVSSKFDLFIIKKKKFYGISLNGETIIPPIYDDIIIISNSIIAIKVIDKFSLYDICSKQLITKFSYTSLDCIDSFWRLYEESNNFILFDTLSGRIINNNGRYDEYNLKCNDTEYYWARKKGGFFDYIDRSSGICISLPSVVMAYDTKYGMFGKDEFGKVSLFDESGCENNVKLRELFSEAGGYLTLTNYTYKIEHIIDVYGNILNV